MFTDTANLSAESRAAIDYLVNGEVVKGTSPSTFSPAATVTREHMALFLWRTLNWARLVADEYRDVVVNFMYQVSPGMKTGTGWLAGPRLVLTGKHVITHTETTSSGTTYKTCVPQNVMMITASGHIRPLISDPKPTVFFYPDDQDATDLALVGIPESCWNAWLDKREAQGLPREPRYLRLPPEGEDEPTLGEPCTAFGAPLNYPQTLTVGMVSNEVITRNELDSRVTEWFATTAGINPGNSGGPVMSFDRRLLGMALLKPFYSTSFGWTGADDMGLVLKAKEIRAWLLRHGLGVLGLL